MHKFREREPIIRNNPKVVRKYNEYKHDLKEDFHLRCGYCNDSDHWCGGWRFFQIDHFIPKKYLVNISITEYSNLIYSCFFCNNSKRAKWPSKNETVTIINNEGFIHPKDIQYIVHLKRDSTGRIISDTPIGAYMIKEMKLDLLRHSIIWNLEKIEKIFEELEVQYKMAKDKISIDLQNSIIELFFEWQKYSKLLKRVENE
jgi:hypothetical protein